jgi:hypothetical protein
MPAILPDGMGYLQQHIAVLHAITIEIYPAYLYYCDLIDKYEY